MILLASLSSIILLGILFYQDFRYLEFSVVILPGLFLLFVFYNLASITVAAYLINIRLNLLFTVGVLMFLFVYISIRNKRFVNISEAHFALGDILFYLTCAFLFSFANFVVIFFVITPFLIITGITVLKMLKVKIREEIPLGGAQAFFVIALFIGTMLFDSFKLNDDSFIYDSFIYKTIIYQLLNV